MNLSLLFFFSLSFRILLVSSYKKVFNIDERHKQRKLFLPPAGNCTTGLGPNQHNGSVIYGTVTLYHIFIGVNSDDYNSTSSTVKILETFASNLSNSSIAKIMLGYNDLQGKVSATIYNFGGNHYTTATSPLTDLSVYTIVSNAIVLKGWPTDFSNNLYLVVFSGAFSYTSNIAQSSWSSTNGWCGFHSNDMATGVSTVSNIDHIIMPVGDPAQASDKSLCAGYYYGGGTHTNYDYSGAKCTPDTNGCSLKAPNSKNADAIISTYSHEIWEAVTDTYGVWYRECDGYENADICNSDFGIVSTTGDSVSGNKVNYNMVLGDKKYLVQHNWLRNNPYYLTGTEKCAISADGTQINNNSLSQTAKLILLLLLLILIACPLCCLIYYCFTRRNDHKSSPPPPPHSTASLSKPPSRAPSNANDDHHQHHHQHHSQTRSDVINGVNPNYSA